MALKSASPARRHRAAVGNSGQRRRQKRRPAGSGAAAEPQTAKPSPDFPPQPGLPLRSKRLRSLRSADFKRPGLLRQMSRMVIGGRDRTFAPGQPQQGRRQATRKAQNARAQPCQAAPALQDAPRCSGRPASVAAIVQAGMRPVASRAIIRARTACTSSFSRMAGQAVRDNDRRIPVAPGDHKRVGLRARNASRASAAPCPVLAHSSCSIS